jgi:hypothetical protein
MPLVSAPNRGYADYQRVGNYDTEDIWSAQITNQAVEQISPILDVSRFAYLGLYANIGGSPGNAFIVLEWYMDAAASNLVGTRVLSLATQISTYQSRIVNLGPFLIINVAPMGGNLTGFFQAFASNRVYPLELVPVNPVLIDQQHIAIAANGTATLYPSDYFAGPMQVAFNAPSANSFAQVAYLSAGNTWDVTYSTPLIAAGVWSVANTVAPVGAWRVFIVNGTSAAFYYLIVTPSVTGAA